MLKNTAVQKRRTDIKVYFKWCDEPTRSKLILKKFSSFLNFLSSCIFGIAILFLLDFRSVGDLAVAVPLIPGLFLPKFNHLHFST